ncbi:MAG: O-acetyl-ADP-ribose deacetylase [Ginsengibacter sp.]
MSQLFQIEIVMGDITKIPVDAIVNAANSSLMGGGGVDGAIHRAGGNQILKECKKIIENQGPCKTGQAVITSAGNLPATYVIHTVGPVCHKGKDNEFEKLKNCYTNCLAIAVENKVKSISFPNISTGVYGFPKKEAARICIDSVINFINTGNIMESVLFVCFDEENFKLLTEYYAKK